MQESLRPWPKCTAHMSACMKNLDHMQMFDVAGDGILYSGSDILITNCTGKIPVASFDAGTVFDRIYFDRQSGAITLYQKGFNSAVLVTPLFTMDQLGLTTIQLVTEVFRFVLRKHSLQTTNCRCNTYMTPARERQLGLHPRKYLPKQQCPVQNLTRTVLDIDIEQELGVTSLDALLTDNKTLRNILEISECLACVGGAWQTIQPSIVQNAAQLCTYLAQHPLGVDENDADIQYSTLAIDLHMLLHSGAVYKLPGPTATAPRRLFAATTLNGQHSCDFPVKKLWMQAAPDNCVLQK